MLAGGSRQVRIVARAALGLGVVGLAASAAGTAGAAKVRFVQLAGQVVQGNQITATVAAPSGRSCVLSVRYRDGDRQQGLQRVRAAGGRVDPKLTLHSASLSAVVFDKAGNVTGGGNGSSSFTFRRALAPSSSSPLASTQSRRPKRARPPCR
jgi:hypothetical protein